MQTAAVFFVCIITQYFRTCLKDLFTTRACYIYIQPHPSSQTLANRDLLFCIGTTICTIGTAYVGLHHQHNQGFSMPNCFAAFLYRNYYLHALDNATTSHTYFVHPSCRHTVGSTTSRGWYLQLTTAT